MSMDKEQDKKEPSSAPPSPRPPLDATTTPPKTGAPGRDQSQEAPSKAAPKKKAATKAKPELEREVTSRLSYLRQAAREAGHNYVVNLEHDLIGLAEAVREMYRAKAGPGKREMERLERVLAVADRVKLKPAKGRRKDLRRIEEAVSSIGKLLEKKK